MIASLAGQGHSSKHCCRMLGVTPSGFFYWQSRPPTVPRAAHRAPGRPDRRHPPRFQRNLRHRRVTAELRLGHEIIANHKAVRRIMLSVGLQGLPVLKAKRRGPATDGAAAGDLVLRQFATDAPTGCGSPTSPSTPRGRASSTAALSWMRIPVASWAGRSTASRPHRW